jgi:NAD(P)-dependent dehydrogenase (short-subunit alcohol dehydrogenase family)
MSMKIGSLFSVQGKVALVTGGSRGIGEMIARAYVENGAKVYISSRKAAACEELAADLSQHGTCIALPADLSSMAEVERLVAELSQRETKLDILMNNAGNTWGEPFETFPEIGWDKVMDLNLKSLFFLTQKALPLLKAASSDASWARVINIASIEGMHTSILDAGSYVVSKAGVIHMSRMLAKKLAKYKIAVNSISPGYFPSKMTDGIKEELGDYTIEHTPMARWGRPEDMAGIALYLASAASAFVTGANIPVDGGQATTS